MISVAIIGDNPLAREGLSALLRGTGQCSVIAAAADADMVPLRSAEPRVVLLDLALDVDGLRAIRRGRSEFPRAALVVMDLMPRQEDLVELVNAGVAGFVMKDATVDELLTTITAVAAGEHILPPEMTTALFAQMIREGEKPGSAVPHEAHLTPREREVILCIREGLSNKRIAARLGIAPQTVKSHVRNIMEKLELHTRLQISAYGRSADED